MTQAELWELNLFCIANALTAFSIYLTVVFAYLGVAYFVGSKLSKIQAFVMSGLFIFAALAGLGGSMAQLRRASYFQTELKSQTSDLLMPLTNANFWVTYVPSLMLIGIFVSLYFMWDVRHRQTE